MQEILVFGVFVAAAVWLWQRLYRKPSKSKGGCDSCGS